MKENALAIFKSLAILLAGLLAFPFFAEAAITYSRSQTGLEITSPFTITVSADSFSDYELTPGVDLYYITLDDDYNPSFGPNGTAFPPDPASCFDAVSDKSATWTVDLPVGDVVKGVLIVGFTGSCETGDEPYYLEGDGEASTVTFTVIGADHDFDTVFDEADNCPATANTDQANNDGDDEGDVCDFDDDNDGVGDEAVETEEGKTLADNCPVTANEDQLDSDADGTGDACDNTPNGDPPPPPPPSGGGGVPPQCANGSDDDADGKADYPNDGGCESSQDNDESGEGIPPPEGEVLGATTEEPATLQPEGEVLGATTEEPNPELSPVSTTTNTTTDDATVDEQIDALITQILALIGELQEHLEALKAQEAAQNS